MKWYSVVVILFCIIISFNFTKPFGFFRESNPALVAITATYWKQNPDIRKQYIPLYSYAFKKDQPPSTQLDNTITTFGYGWFTAPYYFLQLTNIPIGPMGLRIFSLLWLLLTAVAIYKLVPLLTKDLSDTKSVRLLTVCFYVFSPVVMWYQVNGYVHETAVLPLYYFGWYFFLRLINEGKTKWLWWTAVLVFLGIQFDWLPFFQGIVMSAYLLFSRNTRSSKWIFMVPALAVTIGVGYIVYHYASWSSLTDYLAYMKRKFGTRTVGEKGPSYISFLPPNFNIIFFYALSYGVLLIVSVIALIKRKLPLTLWLMIITAMLHHLVFWGFSSEHDYSVLKMAFPLAFSAAMFVVNLKRRTAVISFGIILCCAIAQYYFLHNYTYRKGFYEDENFFVKAGEAIKKHSTDQIIFLNTEGKYFPQIEFYGGKDYKVASSIEEARLQMRKANTKGSAVFISWTNGAFDDSTFTAE